MVKKYLNLTPTAGVLTFLLLLSHFFAYANARSVTVEEGAITAVCFAFVNVSVGNDCTATLTPEMIDGGSFDDAGDPLTFSLDVTGPLSPGEYTVTLFVSDGTGSNSCFSTVTVEDKQAPLAACVASLNLSLGADGTGTLFPEVLNAGSWDNCEVNLSFAGGPITYTCADVGTVQTVTLLVADNAGNTNSCWSNVIIEDVGGFCNEAPVAVCVAEVNVTLGEDCEVMLIPEFIDAGSFDPDGDPLTYTLNITDPVSVGVYSVIMSVSDGSLSSSCFSTVNVEDKQAPLAACVATLNLSLGADGTGTLFPEALDAGSSDNCEVNLSFAAGPITYNCADVGFTDVVNLIVTDASGNSATCFSNVFIQDNLGVCSDNDGDGFIGADDCDDNNATVYPGAPELCDGLDNDCDNLVDEPDNVNATNIWAEAVVLNTINNVSGNNGGYADFTALTTSLVVGNSYAITLTPGVLNYNKKLKWRVYLDLNQDGEFSNGSEKLVQGQSVNPLTESFTIPAGTPPGTIAMRVIVSDKYQQGCSDDFSGEVEDYTVNIAASSALISQDDPLEAMVGERIKHGAQVERGTLQVFPNPARALVAVRSPGISEAATLVVMDKTGRTVHQAQWPSGQDRCQLDVAGLGLAPGVYFLLLQTETEQRVERLVVLRN